MTNPITDNTAALVEKLLKHCALRENATAAREAMEEAADLLASLRLQIEQKNAALGGCEEYFLTLQEGTDNRYPAMLKIIRRGMAALSADPSVTADYCGIVQVDPDDFKAQSNEGETK